MILHTVSRSPFNSFALSDCLKQLGDDDRLLLLNDAVIAVGANTDMQSELVQLHETKRLFVLTADLVARAIDATCGQEIDYAEFVTLTIQCNSQLNWA